MYKKTPAFLHLADVVVMLGNAFLSCSESAGGYVGLLWLAPDHIHLYIESDGEKSVDAIVRYLKRLSAETLNKTIDSANRRLWDTAYFAESLG